MEIIPIKGNSTAKEHLASRKGSNLKLILQQTPRRSTSGASGDEVSAAGIPEPLKLFIQLGCSRMGVEFVPSLTNRDCSIPAQLREGRSERTQLSPRFLKLKLHRFCLVRWLLLENGESFLRGKEGGKDKKNNKKPPVRIV